MPAFYNTIQSTGQQLIDFNTRAESLESRVYNLFKEKQRAMAWCEVHSYMPETNEVSLKRAISNLKNRFKLEKTSELVEGKYKVPNHKYKLI